jgi:Bacterial SCP ortholog
MQKDPKITEQVKEILKLIKELAPGNTVELRIPGYGAIQCVAGGNHRRGTPPNTVEMSGQSLIRLINEPSLWSDLCESGEVMASGMASDLSNIFIQAAVKYRA